MANKQEISVIKTDTTGNILVEDGYVTCVSEGGLEFQISYEGIDFNSDNICCTVDNKKILIKLHDNVLENTISNESNNENINEMEETYKEAFCWTDASTKLFLSLYKDNKDLAQRRIKTKKNLWQKISEKMTLQGYDVSSIQVENKYKSLERSYKNTVTHNKKTGRNRLSCPYETELTELLGGKHNIEPLLLSGNKGIILRNDGKPSTSLSICNENTENDPNIVQTNVQIKAKQHVIGQTKPSHQTSNELTCDTATSDTSDSNTEIIKSKNCKRNMGTTARILETCQRNLEQLSNEIHKENKTKCKMQKEIIEEYKKIRESHEKQLLHANKLREEKNKLLQELIKLQQKNN